MEYSVASNLPFIMMDGPNPFRTLESLEQYLAELQAMPDFDPKALLVEQTKWFIARKTKLEAERKTRASSGGVGAGSLTRGMPAICRFKSN